VSPIQLENAKQRKILIQNLQLILTYNTKPVFAIENFKTAVSPSYE